MKKILKNNTYLYIMKIGIFSTYDDSGAGNAAVKINRALKKKKVLIANYMLV